MERELSPRVLQSDFATFISYLRALGEIGNIERLLHTFAQQPTLLHQPALTYIRNMNRLMLFVFTGQPQRAASLLYDGALAELPDGIKQYWLATAEQTAGQTDAADARLDRIFPTASKSLQAATADRKARPLPINPIAQSEASLRLIQQADDDHRHELLYVRAAPHSRRWAVMTLVLIAANVMVFTVEVLRGGATDWDVLYELGAAETFAVRGGEWWRLFTANFLHFGWLHLAMNMIGLLALGPFVERQFGRIRYAIVYLLAGVLGISYVIFRTIVNARMPEILVGASAAVMGLVGATGAILLVGWWRHRARSAMRRLRGVAMIVGVQILFDAITPQVSGAAHLAGCAAGFLLAIPFCLARREVAEVPTKGI